MLFLGNVPPAPIVVVHPNGHTRNAAQLLPVKMVLFSVRFTGKTGCCLSNNGGNNSNTPDTTVGGWKKGFSASATVFDC